MQAVKVDAGEHLPLIHRVISQMGIPSNERDEAFSEALVAITVAADKYDPSKQVPLANWLGKNIRWSLQNWRESQRRRSDFEAPHVISQAVVHHVYESSSQESVGPSTVRYMGTANLASVASLENHIALREVLARMNKILTPLECNVIIMHALDFPGTKIAKHLGITTVAVSRTKAKAQTKLREALL